MSRRLGLCVGLTVAIFLSQQVPTKDHESKSSNGVLNDGVSPYLITKWSLTATSRWSLAHTGAKSVEEWVAKTEPAHAKIGHRLRRRIHRKREQHKRRPPTWLQKMLLWVLVKVLIAKLFLTILCARILLRVLHPRLLKFRAIRRARAAVYHMLHQCLKSSFCPQLLTSARYRALVIQMLLMLSGDIERNPGPTSLTMADLREVIRAVYNARAKWRAIGRELGITKDDLDCIERNDIDRCLEEMVALWLRRPRMNPSWESLVGALKSATVDRKDVAEEIVQQYIPGYTSEPPPKPSPPHAIPLPPMSPLQEYVHYLRSLYTRSELVECQKWPLVKGARFISLAAIRKENISKELADEFTRATLHGDVDQILKKKEPIKMEDVLSPVSGRKPTCVLVEGCPGVGKTTFSMEVCKKWAQGKMFQDFSTVVLLKLRDKWVQNAKDLSDLIHYSDQDMQKCIATEIRKAQGKDMLIILDGLDELPSSLLTKESVFGQLLSGTCLPSATVLVTSRPSVTGKLLSTLEWSSQISRHIEVLGFTKDNIQEYAKSVLPPDDLPEFMKYLSMHRHIQTMMYIPLNSAIVTEVYKQNKTFKKRDPTTATQLYTDLTHTILQRYLDDHPDYKDLVLELSDFSDLPPPVYSALKELCRIAYDRLMRQEIIFSDLERKFAHLGFMSASNEMSLFGSRRCSVSHSFLHLSIQEYLAAVHVSSQMNPHQQMQLLKQYCEHEYLNNFWRYVFGLTQLKGFDLAVVRKCFIPRNNEITLKLLELLYETQEADCLSVLGDSVISVRDFPLSPSTAAALAYCVAHSKCSWKLALWLDDDTAEILTDGLQNCNASRTGCILRMRWQRANTLYLQRIPRHLLHNITELYIGEVPISSGLVEVLSCMNKLQSLQLNKVSLDFSVDYFEGPQTLRNLELTVSTISTAGATFLQQLILSTRQLDALHLSDTEVTPEGMVIILGALCTVPLQELHMFGCKLQTKVSHALSAVLKANQSLLKLNLKSCIITDHEALHLAEGFHHNTALQEVNMMGTSVSHLGAIAIAEGFLQSMTLKMLSISGILGISFSLTRGTTGTTSMETTHLPPEGVVQLSKVLRTDTSLTQLGLSHCSFNSEGAQAFGAALKMNRSLTKLSVTKCDIGDEGTQHLLKELSRNTTLQELDMSEIKLTSMGAQILAAMLKAESAQAIGAVLKVNRSLTKVSVTKCDLGDEGPQCLLKEVCHNTTLQELDMSETKLTSMGGQTLAAMLKANKSLIKININACGIGDEKVQHLVNGLRNNTFLQEVNMTGNSFSHVGAIAVADVFLHGTTLRNLAIGGIQGISVSLTRGTTGTTSMEATHLPPEGIVQLSKVLRTDTSLTQLVLSHCSFNSESAQHFGAMLKVKKNLMEVSISRCRFGNEEVQQLAAALRHNQTLTTLDMSRNQVGDSGATAIAKALCHNQTLTTLYMSWNLVGDSGITAIAEALRHNQTLTTLGMSHNQGGDSGATAIAEALRHNQTLTTLNMSWNEVRDSGATAIAEALRHNQTLTTLDLFENQIQDRNATAAIAEALRQNKTLTTLDRNSGATVRH